MDRISHQRMKEILDSALEQPPADRAAYLDDVCAEDLRLRSEVQSLLDAHDQDASFLESPILSQPFDLEEVSRWANPDRLLLGEHISRWRLDRVIASGGMGTVYEASDREGDEVVAIKMMRFGQNSESARRRFVHEASVLSRLDHRGIARIFDVGSHDTGMGEVPFFAMEYVRDALPLTEYASTHGLNTHQRLELFIQVCQAVEHGHQKGVVHRDLKPGNILVDADGRPKVIDFGVAQATDIDLATTTLHTRVGQLIGTLAYMSPEQCAGDPDDIDTRSDVYSLGVVLFELLTGSLPYDLHGVPLTDAIKIVRDHPATRPSSRDQTLSGDLDTILLKALEKDRERRYGSVAELDMDVQRHLAHEPIMARPPSAMYQLRKFARRNKGLVAASVTMFVAITAAAAVSTTFAVQKSRALATAQTERTEAQHQAQIADAVTKFLTFDMLQSLRPDREGRDVTMREVLDAAAERIATSFNDDPLIESKIRHSIGLSYGDLGILDKAEQQLTESLRLVRISRGEEHMDTLWAMRELGVIYIARGRYEEAVQLHREALGGFRLLKVPECSEALRTMNDLGTSLWHLGRYEESEPLFRELLEIRRRVNGNNDPATLHSQLQLAAQLEKLGRLDEALELYEETLAVQKVVSGEEYSNTLSTLNNIGMMYYRQGRHEEAATILKRVVAVRTHDLGEEHPTTLGARFNLAAQFEGMGNFQEARRRYEEVIEIANRVLGPDHPNTLTFKNSLAGSYNTLGMKDESLALYQETVAGTKQRLGDDHPSTIAWSHNLAKQLGRMDQEELGIALLEDVVARARRVHGEEHPRTIMFTGSLSTAYTRIGRFDDAERQMTWAIKAAAAAFGEEHWRYGATLIEYGEFLVKVERFDEAEDHLTAGYNIILLVMSESSGPVQRVIRSFAKLYDAWDKPDEAAEWRAKLPDEVNSNEQDD